MFMYLFIYKLDIKMDPDIWQRVRIIPFIVVWQNVPDLPPAVA